MKITAIIAEYNPLHNGHAYHIKSAKEQTSADALLVLMSGNATERGDFSVCDKKERARWATLAGADLVVELPTAYAVNNAQNFATGAVKMLSQLDNVTLSFGSESGDLSLLQSFCDIILTENDSFKAELSLRQKLGNSYPKSLAEAIKQTTDLDSSDVDFCLQPNNILAIEYLKAISGSNITPHTIKRQGNGYSDTSLDGEFCSATAVRKILFTVSFADIGKFVPEYVLDSLNKCVKNNNLDGILPYKINSLSKGYLSSIYDVSEGLENRISSAAKNFKNDNDLLFGIKSKRYTLAKLKRILFYILFDLTKDKMEGLLSAEPYWNVLAKGDNAAPLLSHIASKTNNLVVKTKDLQHLSDSARQLYDLDNALAEQYHILAPIHNI